EGAHEVFGVIKHELITRLCRDRGEGFERVGTTLRAITRYRVECPVLAEEQRLDPCQLVLAQGIGDMRLVHDYPLNRPQAVVELGTGIVVRATGGDGIDGLAARGTGAHDLEKMPWLAVPEVQMSEEQ